MKTLIKNGRVITPSRIIGNADVLIHNGRISGIFPGGAPGEFAERQIDVNGSYVAPGFIDIHTHGGGGAEFMSDSADDFARAARLHLSHGSTTIIPSTAACPPEALPPIFEAFRSAKRMGGLPNMPGLHLEGSYFSPAQAGAQDPAYIKSPDKDEYMKILSWSDDILRWSIAPELPGALEMGAYLREKGILPSIAHSDATYDDVLKAYDTGYTLVTHLYSGCSIVRRINAYRHAGVVESAFLIDDMDVEVIADGHHLPASLLKLIYKIKGPDRICLVTDSMSAAGMPEGEATLASLRVIVEGGVAMLPDKSAFAGSVATADTLVRTMVKLVGVPLEKAVQMASRTPARVMGLKTKGSLSGGMDADIVVFDDDINVSHVFVMGELYKL